MDLIVEVLGEAFPYIAFLVAGVIGDRIQRRNDFRRYEQERLRYSRQRMRSIRAREM